MNLIERFESMTLMDIDEFINTGQEENVYLDFKLINRADLTHADDKKNLAKALSGFSNSSGGLIVWGVEAKKNSKGVDCAISKKDIEPIQLFISRLNEFTGLGVSPIVEGVLHKSIPSNGGKGFAVTLVPESDSGPHMAKMGEDRYYKRSGDSFYRMEHYDLEDMFGRRKKPKLTLSIRIAGKRPNVAIMLGIRNDGRGTAKAPYLAFNAPSPFRLAQFGLDGNLHDGLPKLHHSGQRLKCRYGANSGFVIHPGTVHEVTAVDLGLNPKEQDFPSGEIVIEYEIGAEDTQIVTGSVSLNMDAIA